MKTVLIISEYNPFHLGHKYQIDDIREAFGNDTKIIALMSGSITQRGEFAIMDKYTRAKCAVLSGVNLVLLLPFPYSSSSAEFFAGAGVEIANRLGVVDVLAFGSECGDCDLLCRIAKNMLSENFMLTVAELQNNADLKCIGYPKLMEMAYNKVYGIELEDNFFTPNNILAIEYIKALMRSDSSILPYTTKRTGADYSDEKIVEGSIQSATAIRALMFEKSKSATKYIPNSSNETISNIIDQSNLHLPLDSASTAVLSYLCLNAPRHRDDIHDADSGLYNRLLNEVQKAKSISHLTELMATKKYTAARIRRVIWYSYFGVTSSDVKSVPEYTQALAMDSAGQALLKRIKKTTHFPVITKPSVAPPTQNGIRQKLISDKADALFELTRLQPKPAEVPLKSGPFVKK